MSLTEGAIQRGSALATHSKVVDLFVPYCADCAKANLEDVQMQRFRHYSRRPIFEALMVVYRRGHVDEARTLAAVFATSKHVATLTCVRAADEAEADLLRVAAKLIVIERNVGSTAPPMDEWKYHHILAALSGEHDFHAFTSTDRHLMPSFAYTTAPDRIQLKSAAPPLGVIPNANSTCYASSVLTCLFSIDSVAKMHAQKDDPFGLLTWFLSTGNYTRDEASLLISTILKMPRLSKYDNGQANDVYDFLQDLKRVVDLPDLQIYDIPSLTVTSSGCATKTTITHDFDVVQDGDLIRFIPGRSTMSVNSIPDSAMCKIRRNGQCKSFVEIVAEKVGNRKLPEILVLCHAIYVKEDPMDFPIPNTLILGDNIYSLHAASLYDSHYSGGHYISLVVSETTMFFYDPEYRQDGEDPREYRPRLIFYVRV